MDKLSVKIKNCYGIQKLTYEFDFSKNRQFALYAPNGAMKSSLAKCFQDVEKDKQSTDRIFPERESERSMLADGTPLARESVFVVEPYNETFKSDRVSTLLVNQNLRSQYDEVRREIDAEKDALVKELGRVDKRDSQGPRLLIQDCFLRSSHGPRGFVECGVGVDRAAVAS